VIDVPPQLPHFGDGNIKFHELCGLVPGLMKARLKEVIRGTNVKFGLPAEARARRLAEVDVAIAEVEAQHTALVEAAAEVGITLPLIESVRARREAEALKAERERVLEQERAAGIFRAPWPGKPGEAAAATSHDAPGAGACTRPGAAATMKHRGTKRGARR